MLYLLSQYQWLCCQIYAWSHKGEFVGLNSTRSTHFFMYLSVWSWKVFSFLKNLPPIWIGHRKGLWLDFVNTEFVCSSTEVFTTIMYEVLFPYPSQLAVAGTNIWTTVVTIIENAIMSIRFQVGNRLCFTETSVQEIHFEVCCSLLELQVTVLCNMLNTNYDLHVQGGLYLCWPVRGSLLHTDWCTSGCEVYTNFASESVCLMTDNVWIKGKSLTLWTTWQHCVLW
jgi:hypothetical protein